MALAGRAPALLILCGLVRAQAPLKEVSIRTHPYTPASAVLRADTNLVETGLTVRDARGHTVGGLHASDFEVLDNGVPQQISAFSELRAEISRPNTAPAGANPSDPTPAATPAAEPKFVTFFFDDLHVANGSMLFVKKGARAFIAKGIKQFDHLSIVTASGQGDLDFTTDARRFADALEHVGAHERPVVTGYCGVNPIDSYIFLHNMDGQIVEEAIAAAMKCAACSADDPPAQCRMKAYGIAQQEASATWEQMLAQSHETLSALDYAAKRLAQRSGRRLLVLTSSGFLLRPGVPPELQSFIDAALRSDIVVDAIGAEGLETRAGGPKELLRKSVFQMPLDNITMGTGGHYFKDSNDYAGAMDQAANPEVSYVLAFHPASVDGKFHTLKIRFQSKRSDALQFRPGYFSPDPRKQVSARSRMDNAVFSEQTLHEIPAGVTVTAGEAKDGVTPVSVRVHVDVKVLQFTSFEGRHVQQLAFVTALLGPDGSFVTGEESIMDLALSDEKLVSLQKSGLTVVATLKSPAGAFRVRTIVREGGKGHLAAISQPVEIRAK